MDKNITVLNGDLSDKEKEYYYSFIVKKYGKIKDLTITIDGDYVDCKFTVEPKPFERIRRITGYLVGSMDNWNNAKTAEERDRVKHMNMENKKQTIE